MLFSKPRDFSNSAYAAGVQLLQKCSNDLHLFLLLCWNVILLGMYRNTKKRHIGKGLENAGENICLFLNYLFNYYFFFAPGFFLVSMVAQNTDFWD